jgi:hypothetical protein
MPNARHAPPRPATHEPSLAVNVARVGVPAPPTPG